ncbi:hypothetical protein [Streptomyces sp. CBMA152]|uniref:hypothetical protein n=1 Tax=Streptomyces sp. CBMA152 TaxID=1896312 RepID=UPI0016608F8B|nr:hypothetical protein [Streptomyces sp. CBMA152]MBD0743138.1 hypothetical protein [Streptomyces sp. CBMA152]
MSHTSTALALSARSVPSLGCVAVVAPYGDGGHHAQQYDRHGWSGVAVTLPAETLPAAHRNCGRPTGYQDTIRHDSVSRTARALRARNVSAIVPGSGLGVDLAERLAHALGMVGNLPSTSALRTDRAVQAAALRDRGLAAPRSLRTSSLTAALRWAELCGLPGYLLTAADSAVTAPAAVCTSDAEIRSAWPWLRRAALHESGTGDLVIQERVTGQQFVAHTVAVPGTGQRVAALWSELRTGEGVHGRSDLMDPDSLLGRTLTRYAIRALDVLGVEAGAARCRIAFSTERGPTLLSARAFARTSPGDELAARATGIDPVRAAVEVSVTGRLAPATGPHRHVSRVSLIAPHDGVLDGHLLHTLDSLPTVVAGVGPLVAGMRVRRTVDRTTCPGQIVLAATSRDAIDADYRSIRALEGLGLYGESGR